MNDEETKRKDLADFETAIAAAKKALPDHSIKEFTFTQEEQQLLAQQGMIKTLSELAIDGIINSVVMKRVGIPSDPSVHVRYSVGLGRFVTLVPKELKGGEKKK